MPTERGTPGDDNRDVPESDSVPVDPDFRDQTTVKTRTDRGRVTASGRSALTQRSPRNKSGHRYSEGTPFVTGTTVGL